MRSLHHITLDTGDSAMIPPAHLQPETRAVMAGLITELARHGRAAIPGVSGEWQMTAGAEPGACLSATLMARVGDSWLAVAWLGIARRSRCGASLWASMHAVDTGSTVRTDAGRQPMTPWLATRMLPGVLAVRPDSLAWIADFSECLALTWIGDGI